MRTLRFVAVSVVAFLLAGVVSSVPVSAAPSVSVSAGCVRDAVLCPEGLYFGVSTPGLPSSTSVLSSFESQVGKKASLAMFFQSWSEPLNVSAFRELHASGRLPMLTWEPYHYVPPAEGSTLPPRPSSNPYPLRAVAAGEFDAMLRYEARAVAAAKVPVAIRLGHEMNGDWYPWAVGRNGNTAADFVAFYRRVVEIFDEMGASNVIWVWSPNLIDVGGPLSSMYPGDGYVDWVGLSGYLDTPGESYAASYKKTLAALDVVAPKKPIVIAEVAVAPGPSRASQIDELFKGVLATPRLVGFVWFNHHTRMDWRLEGDAAALEVFKRGLSSEWFDVREPVEPSASPVAQGSVVLSGAARGGSTLSAALPVWRSPASAGRLSVSQRWYRCTSSSSCVATSGTGLSYQLGVADANRVMQLRVVARNDVGSVEVRSGFSGRVLVVPAAPKAPALQGHPKAVKLVLPAVPAGATHWRVKVNGTARPLVAVGKRDFWVTGLVTGRSYRWSLEAVSSDGRTHLFSKPVGGSMVPLSALGSVKVKVKGSKVSFSLPASPKGASSWRVSIDGKVVKTLSAKSRSWTATVSKKGKHSWSVVAVAGSAVSQPKGGSFRR